MLLYTVVEQAAQMRASEVLSHDQFLQSSLSCSELNIDCWPNNGAVENALNHLFSTRCVVRYKDKICIMHSTTTTPKAIQLKLFNGIVLLCEVHVEWCHPVTITENCGMHLDSKIQTCLRICLSLRLAGLVCFLAPLCSFTC